MKRFIVLLITHGMALAAGFALGIYLLPVLIAPAAPSDAEISANMGDVLYTATFTRDLPGSDFLHWGEGSVSITARRIGFMGQLAPGPDYQLYLTREAVPDEAAFLAVKQDSVRVAAIKSFNNFIVDIPAGIELSDYSVLVVWCESFGQFITAASYR